MKERSESPQSRSESDNYATASVSGYESPHILLQVDCRQYIWKGGTV